MWLQMMIISFQSGLTTIWTEVSSLHDGEADDKDLKKAIAEATKAVENLRNYLKK